MTLRAAALVLVLAGCPAKDACDAALPGVWTASGTCFGVARTMTTSFDPDACTVSFGDWATATGTEPTGGVVTGADVALEGGAFDGCVGRLDGSAIEGTCADGCAFELGTSP